MKHRIRPIAKAGYRTVILLFVALRTNFVGAQFYESGTEPPSVKWQQIHTEHFRVIFPVDAGKKGRRAANVLEYIRSAEGKTLGHLPRKIPVVLHNRPAFSNGFVSWAPKRSEWYLTPPQDSYAQNWADQLAVHEYRHVVQIAGLNRGFTKALGFTVGQQSVGAVAGLLPPWFLEGDAVAAETALTGAGRGRNPAFEMPLRAIALSGKYHMYDKALFGSFRDHVPNHYELGYQMVAWTRERYGPKIFETPIDFVARRPYLFFLYPFRFGLRKETGVAGEKLYRNVFDDLTQRWRQQEERTGYAVAVPLNRRDTKLYADYRSPRYLNDSVIVAQKSGIADITRTVTLTRNGSEQTVYTPGALNSERISCSNGLLAWTEEVPDARWTNRSYSVVKLCDMNTGRGRTLLQKTRRFSPELSPDGTTVAVVEVPVEGKISIVLLDILSARETGRMETPGDALLQMPSWSRDGKSLLVIINGRRGKSIVRADIATGLLTTVLPSTFDDISSPVDAGEYALFTGYYNGIANICAVDYRTGEVRQVTSSRFGAFDPSINASGNKMVYSEYSVNGFDIVEMELDSARQIPVTALSDQSLKLHETLTRQENFNMQDSIVPDVGYTVKPYRKWLNLFHIHSWAPMYYEINTADVTSTRLYPGAVLLSQDLTGNLTSSAGWSWRGYNAFHAGFAFKALYPVFDITFDYGGPQTVIGQLDGYEYSHNPQKRNAEITVRSYIPFNLTRNRYITGITPQVEFSYRNVLVPDPAVFALWRGLADATYSVRAYRYLKQSPRDFAPRTGMFVQAAFRHAPAHAGLVGNVYYIYGRIYLPGIFPHHSLQVSGAWQRVKTGSYMYGSLLDFPRGYIAGRTEKMRFGTLEYAFPILYPDLRCGFLVYMKRIRANLFCDAAQNSYRTVIEKPYQTILHNDKLFSAGFDLLADVHLLQITFPVNIGLRTVYVPETGDVQPSLLFNITFN